MANIKQLKHLEHLEDEMLNYGVEGCHAAVRFMQELLNMLGEKKGSGFLQTKWDGAPAIFAGTDPRNGKKFVAKKGIFNKSLIRVAEKYEEVMNIILPTLREERRKTYSPFFPINEKTGKILQVPVQEIDTDNFIISYYDVG